MLKCEKRYGLYICTFQGFRKKKQNFVEMRAGQIDIYLKKWIRFELYSSLDDINLNYQITP